MKIKVILKIFAMYAAMVIILNIISNNSLNLYKLFLGFALLNAAAVLITLYLKYVIYLYKKVKNNSKIDL